jgi:hypothetical protein
MALLAAANGGPDASHLTSMVLMYWLMSAFNLVPWLRLVSGHGAISLDEGPYRCRGVPPQLADGSRLRLPNTTERHERLAEIARDRQTLVSSSV